MYIHRWKELANLREMRYVSVIFTENSVRFTECPVWFIDISCKMYGNLAKSPLWNIADFSLKYNQNEFYAI